MTRNVRRIAGTIFIEAVRKGEIYGVVLLTALLLGWAATFRFFGMGTLHKFYQEVSLQAMSLATVILSVVLSARQLPREFERRTILTVLAKPVARTEFILGKYLGSAAAGTLCLLLFMSIFLVCNLVLGYPLAAGIFLQYVYLQILLVLLAASIAQALSLLFNQDAALTLSGLIFAMGQVFTSTITIIHANSGPAARAALKFLNYAIPQPALFDLSAKVVHGWPPVPAWAILALTAYAAVFSLGGLALSLILFRRRPV